MKQVAAGVERLVQVPLPIFNVYLAGDVLFDAASTWDRRRITRQLEGRRLSLVALTHVHPDHQGLADLLCRERDIPAKFQVIRRTDWASSYQNASAMNLVRIFREEVYGFEGV